jgi:hypothetical protein
MEHFHGNKLISKGEKEIYLKLYCMLCPLFSRCYVLRDGYILYKYI